MRREHWVSKSYQGRLEVRPSCRSANGHYPPKLKFNLTHHLGPTPLAPGGDMVHIGAGRLAKDVPLANRVRSGRKQP